VSSAGSGCCRAFTIKNITTTISKLITQDLFGLEKYLNWGVEVYTAPVVSSDSRRDLITEMEMCFYEQGIRSVLLKKCAMVVEELLMNAIYDAPVDVDNYPLYNHLPRTEPVTLIPAQQGKLRYACDGLLLAVSVEDPFGGLDRQTILDYLESCLEGRTGQLNNKKGGAGRGLFQIMKTADLVVINVKPNIKTEVIAIFNVDTQKAKGNTSRSFHYFFG